ncbi:MAG: hypothetical protein IPJ41_08305 [Phycisphaerales bacterium]|nr:hypothetical protein [Phycisphaerales bacterium]
METAPLQPGLLRTSIPGPAAEVAPRREAEFRHLLDTARAQQERGPKADEARKAAEEFVSMVLVEPILKQVRETNRAAPPFAPTNGEKQFQSMLDARFAREFTRAARFPLVDRLARDLRSAGATSHPTQIRV